MNRIVLLSFLGLSLGTPNLVADSTPIERLEQVSDAFTSVAKKVLPSVVSIETVYPAQVPGHPFFRQFNPQQGPMGSGSGVVYDENGHIITNAHVVQDATEITVTFSEGQKFKAQLVGQDPKTDLAVLKVDEKGLPYTPFGDSDAMEVGDWVLAVGNPLGFSFTVTHGIVSATGRFGLRRDMSGAYEDFIQTDASINQGNSGGPLCNLKGEVIGINSMIASQTGGSQGLGFAIPSNMAKRIVDQLIDTGEVARGFLGVHINDLNSDLAKELNYEGLKGCIVDEVSPDSPAQRAGIESGDIIALLNGEVVENSTDLRNRVSQISPGTDVQLQLMRDGKELALTVILGNLDQFTGRKDLIGIDVRPLQPDELEIYRVNGGVMIENVVEGSPAAEAGLRPEMVITKVDRKPVLHPDDFRKRLQRSLRGEDNAVLLYVKTTSHGFYLVVKVEEEK